MVGAGPFQVQLPMTWGSHASRLVDVLLDGHNDPDVDRQIKLDEEGFDRIVTWIDVNAPYYPDYASAYGDNLYGRSPLDDKQLGRLSELTGLELKDRAFVAHVIFSRPELSPCLDGFSDSSDPDYREALAIIRAGSRILNTRPRADSPGFQLVSPTEVDQEAKYQARLRVEATMRQAIVRGETRYEQTPGGGPQASGNR